MSREVLDRPYSTARFIHTWADLAGFNFTGFEPQKSLVNAAFKPLPLLIGNPQKPKLLKLVCQQKTSNGSTGNDNISLATEGCH